MMIKKIIIYFISAMVLLVMAGTALFIKSINGLMIRNGTNMVSLYIPSGSDYRAATDSLNAKIFIRNKRVFNWVAARKKYPSSVKPGRYILSSDMSYLNIINILRSGNQTPVKVTFNNIRTIYDLAGKVGGQLEADSAKMAQFLKDETNYKKDGFSKETIISVFIPDTYEFFWNTSAEGFYKRMLKEYSRFWNEERLAKASARKLSPVEVSILASIVDCEAIMSDEKPRIAGVYLNRLNRKIKLDADPTIKFALNDFTISRILTKDLQVDSPYNTYKHPGLPPGPIGCPTINGIEAVLNAEKHDYLFFVAKPDFSGYHNFSSTLAEHNRYALLYQKELDKRKIFK